MKVKAWLSENQSPTRIINVLLLPETLGIYHYRSFDLKLKHLGLEVLFLFLGLFLFL